MRVKEITKQIKGAYPEAHLVVTRKRGRRVTEMVAELGIQSTHPLQSDAIAIIEESDEHYHKKTKEIYFGIKGTTTVVVDSVEHKLREGESLTINPGQRHYATADKSWVKVTSTPPWDSNDFFTD